MHLDALDVHDLEVDVFPLGTPVVGEHQMTDFFSETEFLFAGSV